MSVGNTSAAARQVLAYLAAADPPPAEPVDAILGFGVFDLTLPRFCGELFLGGAAPRILFTGGIGAGTGTLGGPEADAWREELRRVYPQIGDAAVILENRSTNTGENVRFTAELLARQYPALAFERGIRSAIIVTSPSRLRRARLTLRQLHPGLRVVGLLPAHDFETERALYAANGVDYVSPSLRRARPAGRLPGARLDRARAAAARDPVGAHAASPIVRVANGRPVCAIPAASLALKLAAQSS